MTKIEFVSGLKAGLAGLPEEEIKERLSFYGEVIDDRIEDGLSEEEAVGAIGGIDGIISQIAAETPFKKLVKERVKPKRELKVWEIVLIAAGFPLWFPLSVAAVAVVFAIYISLWAVAISLIAADIALGASSIGALTLAAVSLFRGDLPPAAILLGAALTAAGAFILMLFACKGIVKGFVIITKKAVIKLKASLMGKRNKL